MLVNVGQAETDLSKLRAREEAGGDVEIGRNGVPAARLVPVEGRSSAGARFLAARGALAGKIVIGDDFDFSESELDEMLDDGA